MSYTISDSAKIIKVYTYRADTKEYIGQADAYIPPNTDLPTFCTDLSAPEAIKDYRIIFNEKENRWCHIEDHRGEIVYCINTGYPVKIENLGSLPDNITPLAPSSKFERWDGQSWVKDIEAEKVAAITDAKAKKERLDAIAKNAIQLLEYAIETQIQTGEETTELHAWKKYRVLLNRTDINQAPEVQWPEVPQKGE